MPKDGEKGIGWAVHCMQGGGKVRRPDWHVSAYLDISGIPGSSKPVIAMHVFDDVLEWRPEHDDLLSRDWEAVA